MSRWTKYQVFKPVIFEASCWFKWYSLVLYGKLYHTIFCLFLFHLSPLGICIIVKLVNKAFTWNIIHTHLCTRCGSQYSCICLQVEAVTDPAKKAWLDLTSPWHKEKLGWQAKQQLVLGTGVLFRKFAACLNLERQDLCLQGLTYTVTEFSNRTRKQVSSHSIACK